MDLNNDITSDSALIARLLFYCMAKHSLEETVPCYAWPKSYRIDIFFERVITRGSILLYYLVSAIRGLTIGFYWIRLD